METKRKGLIAALALGLIQVRRSHLGAAESSPVATAEAWLLPAPVVITTEATTTTEAIQAADADMDLQTACLVDGQILVAAEAAGTITDVEQAALDALRDICDAAGMPLTTTRSR